MSQGSQSLPFTLANRMLIKTVIDIGIPKNAYDAEDFTRYTIAIIDSYFCLAMRRCADDGEDMNGIRPLNKIVAKADLVSATV